MSSKEKTRQKLMDSMRKTKASANKNRNIVETEVKTNARNTSATRENVPVTKRETNVTRRTDIDPYQSRRPRVWPD